MIEKIIVMIIVAIAVFILGRKIYVRMNGEGTSCGCAGCSNKEPCLSKHCDSNCDIHQK